MENAGNLLEHEVAITVSQKLEAEKALLITTDYILDEAYTLLRSILGYKAAILFGQEIQRGGIEIVQIDPSIQKEAWEIFEKYSDKDFSFTDCTSFVVMNHAKIETAFTFDRHFQQYGLRTLPHRLPKKGK